VPIKELTEKYVNNLPAASNLNPQAESFFPRQCVTIGQPAKATSHPVQAEYHERQPQPIRNESVSH
jgi:hypothetical protein